MIDMHYLVLLLEKMQEYVNVIILNLLNCDLTTGHQYS